MDPKDGFAIITEGGDSVESVIKTIAGTTDLTEKERDALISGAIDQGLLRRKSDGKLEVIPGKAAPIKKVWSEGNRSLEMLERVNAVKRGLQGIQEVVLGAARVYGAVASIATAPVTTLVGASAGVVSRAFYEEQYNNRQATLGQLAQSAELGSAVANIGVAAVNLARVAARAVSIGDDIIQLGIAGGPKPNISPAIPKFNFEHLEDDVPFVSKWSVPKDAEYVFSENINNESYLVAYGQEVSEEVLTKFKDAENLFPISSNEPVTVYNAHSIERLSDGTRIRALTTISKDGNPNMVFLTPEAQNDLLALADEASHQVGYRSNRPHERFYNYLLNTPEGRHKFIEYIWKHEPNPELRLQYKNRAFKLYEKAEREGK